MATNTTTNQKVDRTVWDQTKWIFEASEAAVQKVCCTESEEGEDNASVLVYSEEAFVETLRGLQKEYPENSLHCLAVKANPIAWLLEMAYREVGFGSECASLGEVKLALRAGVPGSHIVFDSSCKTIKDLQYALAHGVYINADNMQELERIHEILANPPKGSTIPTARVGLRLNPQVGAGSLEVASTATAHAKFGIPMADPDGERTIIEAFNKYEWLTGLHVHIGSQFCPLDLIASGVAAVDRLLKKLPSGRVTTLDLGGGLPVDLSSPDIPQFAAIAAACKAAAPEVMSGKYRIITEFGRALNARAGIFVSRIEYTKSAGGHHLAISNIGADVFLPHVMQRLYVPVIVLTPDGKPKDCSELILQDIVGPMCFGGDVLTVLKPLPRITPGDYLCMPNTGAYTLSMWSVYNVRAPPTVCLWTRDKQLIVKSQVLWTTIINPLFS